MWYALMDMSGECDSMTWLLCGSLQDIAEGLLEQCRYCDPSGGDDPDFDALAEDGEAFFADDYIALSQAQTVTADLMEHFSFELGGSTIEIHCLAEGYQDFRKAFEEYDGENFWLQELILPQQISPAQEAEFAKELGDILYDGDYMKELPENAKYIRMKADD